MCRAILLIAILASVAHSAPDFDPLMASREPQGTCQPLALNICKSLNLYDKTRIPNYFGQETQEEAGLEVNQFWPLVKINCSDILGMFLCSLYAPPCMSNYDGVLPPCRSMCEAARDGCAPVMTGYGFQWPEKLRCDNFPEKTADNSLLCMSPPKLSKPKTPAIRRPPRECECSCKDPFVPTPVQPKSNRRTLYIGNVSHCTNPCHSPYYQKKPDQQDFTVFWIGMWAAICCVSTLVMILTFFIDTDRFKYPERSIVFISICYFCMSLGYIIRLFVGHEEVACNRAENTIRTGVQDSAACTIVFLLIYIFGMASSMWWVILTITWFLAAGLKWSTEAISKYAQYFHFAAWGLPTVKAIAIFAMSAVDGDPVAGICYVGNTDVNMLRGFILAPLFAYLVIGCLFLLAGFISLFRIRHIMVKQQGKNNCAKLERLMYRIGIFSALYTVPATMLIGVYFYEQHYRDIWEKSLVCEKCLSVRYGPHHAVFMLKYVAQLGVGVAVCVWILNKKTLQSWYRFYEKICCCCRGKDVPIYQPAEAIITVRSDADLTGKYHPGYNHVGNPYNNC